MLSVDASETPAEAMPPLPERLRPIAPLGAPTVSRRLVLPEAMTMNAASGRVRLLTRQERPGARMYQCHILEHEQLGMTGIVDVQA
ncbi:multicopper oxidase domain-containing protein [Mesorhizobium sp.]|uniref:multicopper oxidase domain-containing protein n=1 Tax=Mesorhizobium sp. TaxID=1871066 RepID=UPI0025F4E0A5|nr:multicopper oxidase domain-containing protein [Mesorhizobium sp.]